MYIVMEGPGNFGKFLMDTARNTWQRAEGNKAREAG